MNSFELNAQLESDTLTIGQLPLCQVLLMNDKQFPWLILVPRVAHVREIHQLDSAQQQQLWQELTNSGEIMMSLFQGFKLNTAALGNLVPQLHVHQIVRFEHDPAWPNPVWGRQAPIAYSQPEMVEIIAKITGALTEKMDGFVAC